MLSLDGGGIAGTCTASALAASVKDTGLRMVDHFDLIAGTSTGGILALGLGLDPSGAELLDFYRQEGPRIFSRPAPHPEVQATAAAPTFFQAARIAQHEGAGYVDGGVWANNPALAAVVEAVHFLKVPLDRIEVLRVGTTYAPDSVRDLAGSGLFGWGRRILDLLMNAQVEAAWKQAMLLVGPERFLRVNCETRPGDDALDNADEIDALAAMGRGKAVEKAILGPVRARFLNGVAAEPFRPLS